MAAALLVACSLAVSGCSDKKTEEPAPPAVSYGVVDLETLVKAHPKYSTYFRLETEYNHLLDQYQNERNKLIHIASQQQHIKAALSDQSRRMAAENEWKTKVKAKEDELNDGLAKLYKTISEAHKKDRTFTPDGLTDEERAEMANLQMKLTVLGVTALLAKSILSSVNIALGVVTEIFLIVSAANTLLDTNIALIATASLDVEVRNG